jgi:hypothetical protein
VLPQLLHQLLYSDVHAHALCSEYVGLQYSEIPIQATDQDDLQKLLNATELAELKTRVRVRFAVSVSACVSTTL